MSQNVPTPLSNSTPTRRGSSSVMLNASKDDLELLQSEGQQAETFQRSKSDPVMDKLLRVVQYDESDTEVCYKFYEEEEHPGTLEYNYHDFSHSTWYDFTKEKTPIPATIEKHTCDDIRICLPIHAGCCYSLRRCISGVVSGWGFTSKPREPFHYYLQEAMNGILCGMTMLPEVISFSFIAGIPIQVALHGSWILCLCATVFGGSPGIVTGVSGAFAAVAGQYSTISAHGGDIIRNSPEYQMCLTRMFVAIILASILLLIFSFIHMASLSQFLSTSVIIGYSNGLALIIARAQLHGFQNFDTGEYLRGKELYISLLYCIIAFLLVQFANKIPRIGKYIPSALLAVVVVIIIHYCIVIQVSPKINISTIGSVARLSRETCIPHLFFITYRENLKRLQFDMALIKQVLTFTGSIMLEALIIADIVKTLGADEPNSNQQFFGLGIGNLFSSILGSMGGSSMVGITIMNFKSGSKGKESSLSTALFIFAMMFGGYPMLNYIPIPSLCGIMFSVSCHCFKWFSIPMVICSALPQRVRSLHPKMKMKISRYDAVIILSVTLMCLFFIVPVAVFFGMVLAAFSYVWESKSKFKVEIYVDKEANIKYYEVDGNIFYASKRMLTRVFTPQEDPQTTVIVFLASTSLFDYTAIEALNSLKAEYASYNKSLLIKGLSHGCIKKVAKMNHLCRHMEHDLVRLTTPNLPTLYAPFFKAHTSEHSVENK